MSKLCEAQILDLLNINKMFEVDYDACEVGVGDILMQNHCPLPTLIRSLIIQERITPPMASSMLW